MSNSRATCLKLADNPEEVAAHVHESLFGEGENIFGPAVSTYPSQRTLEGEPPIPSPLPRGSSSCIVYLESTCAKTDTSTLQLVNSYHNCHSRVGTDSSMGGGAADYNPTPQNEPPTSAQRRGKP